jgi:sulfite exporter TauE/SafE
VIESVLAAGLAGVLATAHCAAMCGPIAAAATCSSGKLASREAWGYFAARLLAYATVGAALGTVGSRLVAIAPLGALQTTASLAVALLAIAKAASVLRTRDGAPLIDATRLARPSRSAGTARSIVSWLTALVPRRGIALGVVTAVLPCGALVPAWILAATTTSPHAGAATMATFAIASAPGLVVAVLGSRFAAVLLRNVPARAQAAGWLALAAWMMARPLLGTACCALRL